MQKNNIYIGSSLVVVFKAKDNQGANLDISGYEKEVTAFTGITSKLIPEITSINSNSFSIELSGEETKKLGSGVLNIVVYLKKDKDERTGKACPITLISPNSSDCGAGNVTIDNGNVSLDINLESTSISFDLIMGSTIINNGGGSGEIPTKVSQLDNDLNFVKAENLPLANQTFIDLWNNTFGQYGSYDATTNTFSANGFTGFSYEMALNIYSLTGSTSFSGFLSTQRLDANIPTNAPLTSSYSDSAQSNFVNSFNYANLEVLNIASKLTGSFGFVSSIAGIAFRCPKLKKVIGNIMIGSTSTTALSATTIFNMPLCEEFKINLASYNPTASTSIYFANLAKINLESLTYLVNSYTRTQTITIRVHADIYAKLTNASSFPQWAQLVTTAQAKNITFAL